MKHYLIPTHYTEGGGIPGHMEGPKWPPIIQRAEAFLVTWKAQSGSVWIQVKNTRLSAATAKNRTEVFCASCEANPPMSAPTTARTMRVHDDRGGGLG